MTLTTPLRRGGGFGGFAGFTSSQPNNDNGVARPTPPRRPTQGYGDQGTPVFFNPQGQTGAFFNPVPQPKPVYTMVKRQDAVNPNLDSGYTDFPRNFGPLASPTPVPNAGAYGTPAYLPTNSSPPDAGGLGDINNDIPPADYFPNGGTTPSITVFPGGGRPSGSHVTPPSPNSGGGPSVALNPNYGGGSPYGAGIMPGLYGGMWPGDANQYGNIFEGYMNGMPVFTAQTLSGAYPSSVSNPSGIASGGNTGGVGWNPSNSPSSNPFGSPGSSIAMAAPGNAQLGQMFAYARAI